jgi:predicted nucleic acid-binding protein
MKHPEAPVEVRAWARQPPAWLEEMQVQQVDASIPAELGVGEREAISLALEIRAGLLLIDERAGRHEAKVRNIAVAGTLAVLLQADLRGYIDFPAAMKQLRQLGFRTSESIEASVMALYEQAKNSKP